MSHQTNFTHGATLGCGAYRALYRRRNTLTAYVCEADLVSGSYSRVLNDVSTAEVSVRIKGDSEECCGCYGQLNPWEHELAIFRDGTEVWCGPITNIELDFKSGVGTVQARDLMAWADVRVIEPVTDDYDVEDADLKDIFDWVLQHAYCKDPWGMTWSLEPTGVPAARYYPAVDRTTDRWGGTFLVAGDELRDLASAGVDFTVIGRHLWGGSLETSTPVPVTAILMDHHWMDTPSIKISGEDMATRLIGVAGNGGYEGYENSQVWIEPPNPLPPVTSDQLTANQLKFGLMERLMKESSIDDVDTEVLPNQLTQSVFGKFELTHQPFIYIDGGKLSQNAPLDFNSLIPGIQIDVRLLQSCRIVNSFYRLTGVDVSFSNGVDDISVKLTPTGVDSVRT